jgi:hypothetical protein
MNDDLLKTLHGLRQDRTLAIVLYEQLFKGRFWALIQKPVVSLEKMFFLNYPTPDDKRELPIFTADNRKLLLQLTSQFPDSVVVGTEGGNLWPRLLDVVSNVTNCDVAVDAGEQYGIRMTKEMILGMISIYGIQVPPP